MTFSPQIIAALDRGELVLRDFFVVQGKTHGGSPATFAYWTGEDNVAANVVAPGGTTPQSVNFVGGGTLLTAPDIVDAIGFEAHTVKFGFDHTSKVAGSPMDMVFGHNIRIAPLAYYWGVFDPDTWQLVDNPALMFAGQVDGAAVDDAAENNEGGLFVDAVQAAIEMTAVSTGMKSDEQQRTQRDDRFRRYGDTAGQFERWWGQAKSEGENV